MNLTSFFISSFIKSVKTEAQPYNIVKSFFVSIIVALVSLVRTISLVALIFAPLVQIQSLGTELVLITTIVVGLSIAFFSSFSGAIGGPQERIAPILAYMMALIIGQMQGHATEETIIQTVLAASFVSTLIVGLVLVLVGSYQWGNAVRFIPYPVIGGFLAGSGWLLIIGSFNVASGQNLTMSRLVTGWYESGLAAWLPSIVFGVVATLATRRFRHPLTLPALVLFALVGFYGWLYFTGHAIESARAQGYIFSLRTTLGVAPMKFSLLALQHADWLVVLNQYGSIIAMVITALVSILLNSTALELAADEEIDLNQELKASGVANLAAAFFGGIVGFQSLNLTLIALNSHLRSRLVGLFTALSFIVLLYQGLNIVEYLPMFILSGILFYTGFILLVEWVYEGYFKLIFEDYLLVMLILAIVAIAGYLQGVGAGVIIASVLFAVKYSSVSVVSRVLTGDKFHSTVDRSARDMRLLHSLGEQIFILHLKGYIFFGSSNTLYNNVRDRSRNKKAPTLSYAILDFQRVSGMDSSGFVSLAKLGKMAAKENFIILLTSVTDLLQNQLNQLGLVGTEPGKIRIFRDRDHAIEWCEDQLLQTQYFDAQDQVRALPQILLETHPWPVDTQAVLNYFTRLEVEKNHYLILQDDPADELYFIESGKVKVILELDNGQTIRARTMGAGTIVGEIGLYLKQPRVASIVTVEPCVFYALTLESLTRMEKENPQLSSAFHEFMVRVLAERVTQQNRTIRALMD